ATAGGPGTAFSFVIDAAAPDGGVGTSTVTVPGSAEIAACIAGVPTPDLVACNAAAQQIDGLIEAAPGIGTGNMYVVAANGAVATGGAAPPNSLLVQTVGVGALNQTKIGGFTAGGTGTFVPALTATVVQAQKATYDAQDMGGCGS